MAGLEFYITEATACEAHVSTRVCTRRAFSYSATQRVARTGQVPADAKVQPDYPPRSGCFSCATQALESETHWSDTVEHFLLRSPAGTSSRSFGQGPVGRAATQLVVAQGARVIALNVNADRLLQAKEFGADAAIT